MTSSINYLHREKFRSDVLITFHPPIVLTPQNDANLFSPNKEERTEAINKLTELLESTVRSNLLDAQDWDTVRVGHVARKIYAGHLGTRISLGQYVRLTRKFVAAFSHHQQVVTTNGKKEDGDSSGDSDSSSEQTVNGMDQETIVKIDTLAKDLAVSFVVFLNDSYRGSKLVIDCWPFLFLIVLPRSTRLLPSQGLPHQAGQTTN